LNNNRQTTSDNTALYGDAERAEREAAKANEHSLVLQAKVLELEAKRQDRAITGPQIINFLISIGSSQKGTVLCGVRHPDGETQRYASKINRLISFSGFNVASQLNYPDNLVVFNENSCIALLVDNSDDAPPYATNLYNAFNAADMNPTWVTNNPNRLYSQTEGHPSAKQVIVLVGEKPQ